MEDLALSVLYSGRKMPDEMRAFARRVLDEADDYEQELLDDSNP